MEITILKVKKIIMILITVKIISFFLTMKSNKNNDFPIKKSLFIYSFSFFYGHIFIHFLETTKKVFRIHT